MKIALATCRGLPEWEIDDRPLHAALARRGVTLDHPIWDDPAVDWKAFDAVLIRTTWDYMERPAEYIAWAHRVEQGARLFNSAGIIEWNLRKTYLRDLESKGVRIAPTRWFEPGDEVNIARLMEQEGWPRGFIKPVVGATARETLRFDADTDGLREAQAHIDRVLTGEGLMAQPYLSRVETDGEYSALFFDNEYSHGVRKVPVSGDYRVQDDFGAHDEPYSFNNEEMTIARRIVDCVEGDLLYGRVDFLRDDKGELCLNELELVEPSLFLRHDAEAGERLADGLVRRVQCGSGSSL